MRALRLLSAVLFASTSFTAAFSTPRTLRAREEPPRNGTGLSDAVQWDNTTFWIEGQRIFLHSGEFHTFRLPVPDLWLDIFQKMVAAGLNGVRCAYSSPGLRFRSKHRIYAASTFTVRTPLIAALETRRLMTLQWVLRTPHGMCSTSTTGVRCSPSLTLPSKPVSSSFCGLVRLPCIRLTSPLDESPS